MFLLISGTFHLQLLCTWLIVYPFILLFTNFHLSVYIFPYLNISFFQVFSYACHSLLRPYNSNKLQPHATQCVFLGYSFGYKGYLCYDISKDKFYTPWHVVLNEQVFPFEQSSFNFYNFFLSSSFIKFCHFSFPLFQTLKLS